MALNIITGKQNGAMKTVIYGPEGIGKSTLASRFPRPLFIDTEGSTRHMDVRRTQRPRSWTQLLEQVKCVRDEAGICSTLSLDTADWAEQLCITSICDSKHLSGIEDMGYGKGYVYLAEEFGRLLNLLEEVVGRGINVVLTAHAMMRKFEQPDEMGAYDRWELKLQKKTAALVKEWADLLLFANYKTLSVATETDRDGKGKKYKAQGGKRVKYSTHHPCWDAKNRLGLPDELPLDYAPLAPYFEAPAAPKQGTSPPAAPSAPAKPDVPPAQTKEQAAPPAGETKPDTAPEEAQSANPSGDMAVPEKLKPLLASANVDEFEVREVIAQRQAGFFPMGTSWKTMQEAGFVDGWVIPFWDKIVDMIQSANDDRLPF